MDNLKSLLTVPYKEDNFKKFSINFLKNIETLPLKENKTIPSTFKNTIESYTVFGSYEDGEGSNVIILSVKVKNNSVAQKAQRQFISYLLTNAFIDYNAALVAYHDEVRENWKLSFVTVEYSFGENGVELKFKPAKRFSFLVGKDEPTRTYVQQLNPIYQSNEKPTLTQLTDAFSVSRLSKDFYEEYKNKFFELYDYLVSDNEFRKEATNAGYGNDIERFATTFCKKTLGQIMFLHFVQKKGWMGVTNIWGDGDKQYLINSSKSFTGTNYFHEFLEPLFYRALNVSRPDDLYLGKKIPFLNGGLFHPIEDYDWQNTTFHIPNDYWFNKNETGLLNVLSQYNFTVDEADVEEQEVAIDPEMLGKIFESLLDTKNRADLGAFYTPREIVHYMCEEILARRVANELSLDYRSVLNFIKYGDALKETEFIKSFAKDIDEYVSNITIVDPSVGSGAFLVGMLNQIVKLRNSLLQYTDISIDKYSMKIKAIQNCLYGVDIEYDAVEIAKLRLWLSLIVDQETDGETPKPLPNLNFHLRVGNSLVDSYEGIKLWNIRWRGSKMLKEKTSIQLNLFNTETVEAILDRLKKAKVLYFNTSDEKKKMELSKTIEREQIELIRSQLVAKGDFGLFDRIDDELKRKRKPFFIWELEFEEVFENGGFDIVIGNPPYIKEMGNSEIFDVVNQATLGKKYHQGKMDYWYYFLHQAISLIKDNGLIMFITSRYWLNSAGASGLRRRVKDELKFAQVVDIGDLKVFESVVGYHMICEYTKNLDQDAFVYKKIENTLDDINSDVSTDNIHISEMKNSKLFKGKSNEIIFEENNLNVEVVELGNIAKVSQGVIEASDSISSRMYKKQPLDGYTIGEGIFVLDDYELKALNLNEKEKSIIKRYIRGEDIHKYSIDQNKSWLIYTDKKSRELVSLDPDYVHIKQHLDHYYTYITSSNKPYGLHRPRTMAPFESEKIIMPNMFSENNFAIDYDNSYYTGMGCQTIYENDKNYPLEYILAILNSSYAMKWFNDNCKHRGAGVDVGVNKIRTFPIAIADSGIINKVVNLVKKLQLGNLEISQNDKMEIIKEIDSLINDAYKI